MMVKTTITITTLNSLSRQFEKLCNKSARTEDDVNEAVNTVIGCLHIVARSPTTNLRNWIARRPRRKALVNPARAIRTKQGLLAIRELIALAVSVVNTDETFLPEVYVGPLPAPEPRRLSPAHLLALHRGRDERQKQKRLRREEVERRIRDRIAG